MTLAPSAGPMAPDLDLGAFVETVDTFTNKNGEVVITRHENGWTVKGRNSRTVSPGQEFLAEISDCTECPRREKPGTRNFGPRPVCKTFHAWGGDHSTKHFTRDYCHELGHIDRVQVLAQNVLRTY
ncbi:hypothetical protein CLV30_12557 [Haloactinopolyspora alba]|uniref:Uncharacterized protein n=1 Tax=Haloactinopolyspora alba TaxID=648780 RepID=A0A2P8DHI9_9ACTN|nr:hypothetical protein [Haloactinopolyspora alba]PSK96675.1 hypothetical protein CLV30_12557 [Haloactinopolyspora alba]